MDHCCLAVIYISNNKYILAIYYKIGTIFAIVVGYLFSLLFSVFPEKYWPKICFPIYIIQYFIAFLFLYPIKEELRRENYEGDNK